MTFAWIPMNIFKPTLNMYSLFNKVEENVHINPWTK
jgi:hypothetical protein